MSRSSIFALVIIVGGLGLAAPSFAQMQEPLVVTQTQSFNMSGNGSGTTRYVLDKIKPHDARLGTLNFNRVSFESTHSSGATYGPGGFSSSHSVSLRASENFGTSDLNDSQVSWAICEGPCTGGTQPLTWRPGAGSIAIRPDKLGGPIAVVNSSNFSGPSVSGSWSFSGTALVEQMYTPHSTGRYIRDAVRSVSGADYERATEAYGEIIDMRETSSVTASKNLNLRDAEYFLRGFAGGVSTFMDIPDFSSFKAFFYDIATRTGPVATTIYNGLKAIQRFFGDEYTGGDGNHPNTPVGGFTANLQGYTYGSNGVSLNDAANRFGTDGWSTPLDALDELQALIPQVKHASEEGEVSIFQSIGSSVSDLAFFDPKVAKYLTFGVNGTSFTGIKIIPDGDAPQQIWLHINGQRIAISTGEYFSFKDISPTGVKGFFIEGLGEFNPDGDNFKFGATFADAGDKLISVVASDFENESPSEVPEPGSAALVIVALGALYACRRRKHGEQAV